MEKKKKTTFQPLCLHCPPRPLPHTVMGQLSDFSVGVFIKKHYHSQTEQFLNHHPDKEREEYLKPKISHFGAKLSWRIWGGSFFKADSTPFQLALVIVEAEPRRLIKPLSPLLVLFPASLPKRTF